MEHFEFCPNRRCQHHMRAPRTQWWNICGSYETKTFGTVPRFRCKTCRKTFSTQTFSIDYYAKKLVDYDNLLVRQSNAESIRGIGRALSLSCGTVLNRIDRLARQAISLHAQIRTLATAYESICIDGFVGFDVSQFFPNEITCSITSSSRFILDLSHATRRRSGTMSAKQAIRAAELYPQVHFERGAISRSFGEVLESALAERPPAPHKPFILITDEKKEYEHVVHRSKAWRDQDDGHRIAHLRVTSTLPRTWQNPLFPSNYLDREIRKDQAAHHRDSVCFGRNASNGMSRLACYLVQHNYRKRFLIKAPVTDERVHGEVAGIPRQLIDHALERMFTRRAFLSRISLLQTLSRIWMKAIPTPLKMKQDYLPAFALG
jgi:hypothetical protein